MNTKNAINKIKYILNEHLNDGITKDNLFEAIDIIKDKLKRGEKFEDMWKGLEMKFKTLHIDFENGEEYY